jgi:hypothetical protein
LRLQWWHHRYCWKDLDEINPTIPRKITNCDRSGPHKRSKDKWAITTYGRLVWPTPFTVCDFFCAIWFILSRYLQQYLCCRYWSFSVFSRSFYLFFIFFISPISSQTTRRRDGRIKERKKIKWYWRHSETPMMASPVLLERSRQDEFNDTKKSYKQWMKWVIRAIQSYQDSLASASLVWPTPITDDDFPWYRCILLVEIFLTVLVMLSLEFWCVFKFFF